jgi:hypothetical protein
MMTPIEGYHGRWRVIVFSTVLLGVVATTSWAQITNLSNGGSVNFSALVGTNGLSVLIGDKLFSSFAFGYLGNVGDAPAASNLVLYSLFNEVGSGIEVQLPLFVRGAYYEDITLGFAVEVTNSNNEISDVHLHFQGSAGGNGFAQVSESNSTNGPGAGTFASLSLTQFANNVFDPPSGEATAIYSEAQSKIWVEKDILVSGNGNVSANNLAADYATISRMDQTFSQIPEPSTIVLSLAGMVALLFVRRRQ